MHLAPQEIRTYFVTTVTASRRALRFMRFA
jgi:hypothetical protein